LTAAAYVPLSFAPGEAYQFDWSHEVVLLNGVTVIVKAAHVRLCHSRMLFVRCYPRETQEMVFDAHDRAFALFKGTCGRGIYDNMKTAVEAIFVGKGRLYNRRFMQMCSHYLVDPVACTPASGCVRALALTGRARAADKAGCRDRSSRSACSSSRHRAA
jgi:transposase